MCNRNAEKNEEKRKRGKVKDNAVLGLWWEWRVVGNVIIHHRISGRVR